LDGEVNDTKPYHVTFICSGNICRSPMGEVILRDLLAQARLGDDVEVDSAGTTGYEVDSPADARAVAELRRHGYDGSAHVARQFRSGWFAETDLVLAADEGHVRALRGWAPTAADAEKIRLMREFDPEAVAAGTLEVDDPWYGEAEDFERCFGEVEASCRGVLKHLQQTLARSSS
jgi:protein-tyrosine phosphatase